MSRLILLIILVAPFMGIGQTQKISGSVMAFNKFPLNNVTVKAKKSKAEAITDDQGHFEIEVNKKDQIRIQESGFLEYTDKISSSEKSLRINLIYEHSEENMEKVTQGSYLSRTDLEYGLNNLANENNVFGQFNDVFDAIKYAIPQATITIWEGRRGAEFRGRKTFTDSNPHALTVVDGLITEDISFMNPVNITSIVKLENTAAAVYGARAGNGVIAIQTRFP